MSSSSFGTENLEENLVPMHVVDMAVEPSYMSEIARKLQDTELAMIRTGVGGTIKYNEVGLNTVVSSVSKAVDGLEDAGRVNVREIGYEDTDSQEEASPLGDISESDREASTTWLPYALVTTIEDVEDMEDGIEQIVDEDITVSDKIDMIKTLSEVGNSLSKRAEEIFQDVMERQFRYFDETSTPNYADPDVDFYVNDENQVDFGLALEISNRHENPIGLPYMERKVDRSTDMDADLTVIAPSFTDSVITKWDDPEDIDWRQDPYMDNVRTEEVPREKPYTYKPFPRSKNDDPETDNSGFPVLVPDSDKSRNMFSDSNHISSSYPMVTSNKDEFINILEHVHRDYDIITESQFRLQVREAIEPSLWKLMNPYRVEQFLIDMYWDTGIREGQLVSQEYVGRLVDRSGSTIGDWMGKSRWDIITRGGGTKVTEETVDIWERMYTGRDPFPEEFTGYRIQAEYNRFPQWDLSDWRDWYQNKTEEERADIMMERDSFSDNMSYTVMMESADRLLPSYGVIIQRLKERDVAIRPADLAPRGAYRSYGDAKTIEWMINRDESTVVQDTGTRETFGAEEAEVFDSYLEVDIASWFSDNEVPYAHEPFTVPSMHSEGRELYDIMTEMVRANGQRDVSRYEELQQEIKDKGLDVQTSIEDDTGSKLMLSELSPFFMRDAWNEIFDKHRLADEGITPEVIESLSRFQKQFLLPDLVLYRDFDGKNVPQDWEKWDTWTEIIEVGGLWGVGLPDDADDEEWWLWYRVSAVAFKELIYKLLGLWEDVIFLLPNQVPIEGVSEGTPQALRRDDRYILFNSTQADIVLDELANRLGGMDPEVDSRLSPPIPPTRFNRDIDTARIDKVDVDYSGINMQEARRFERTFIPNSDMIVYAGELGEVFLDGENAYVKESQFRHDSLVMLREYIADSLVVLSEENVVEQVVGV